MKNADVIIVATKPSTVPEALTSIRQLAAGKLFLSVAMGITISELEKVSPFDISSNGYFTCLVNI